MILTQEDLNKLNQLDRIEFRQERDEIRKRYSSSVIVWTAMWLWLQFFLWLGCTILLTNVTKEINYLIMMLSLEVLVLKTFLCVFILALVADIVMIIKYRKNWKELILKYKNKIPKRKIVYRRIKNNGI